jgi:hypothetical protein
MSQDQAKYPTAAHANWELTTTGHVAQSYQPTLVNSTETLNYSAASLTNVLR